MGAPTVDLGAEFLNAQGWSYGPVTSPPSIPRDTDWTRLDATLTVPNGAAGLLLKPEMIHAFGTVDFDDISVTVATEH